MIYVVENGVEDQAFSTGPLAHRLIRHPLIKPPELMETYYQNIKDGTHVGVIYPTIMEMDVDIQPQLRGKITRFDFRLVFDKSLHMSVLMILNQRAGIHDIPWWIL